MRGKQAIAEKVLVRGKRHSVISAMNMNEIMDISITRQSVGGDLFYEFVERKLLPKLLPFKVAGHPPQGRKIHLATNFKIQ